MQHLAPARTVDSMTTQTEATRTAIAHRAAMRATARAVKALQKAHRAAHHPRATSADWIHLDACKLEKIHAEAQQETARMAAQSARLLMEARSAQPDEGDRIPRDWSDD